MNASSEKNGNRKGQSLSPPFRLARILLPLHCCFPQLDGPEGSSIEVFALDVEGPVAAGTGVTVEWEYDDGDGRTEVRIDRCITPKITDSYDVAMNAEDIRVV